MQNGKIIIARIVQKCGPKVPITDSVVNKLDPKRFRTLWVYFQKDNDNYLEADGRNVFYLFKKKRVGILPNPLIVWRLMKILKANNVDIVHCHRHKGTVYGTLAARMAGIPVVFAHVHGLDRTRNMMRRIVNRFCFNAIDKILTISEAVRQDVLATNPSLSEDKVVLLGNSINYDRFSQSKKTKRDARIMLGLPPEGFVFGTVGRLVPTKGYSYLVEAFAKVRHSLPTAHLVFVGDGRLENELKQQAARLHCLDAITFAGTRSDIPDALRAFDCFVFPSIAEGFGCALAEAMAASLPCIASAVGGIPEILDDKKLGYLVTAKDIDSIAHAMIDCAAKPEKDRFMMGELARAKVEHFYSHDVLAARLEKYYEDEFLKATGRNTARR